MATVHCSLDSTQDCLQPLSMQALPASPESLCMVEMGQGVPEGTMGMTADPVSIGGLFLNIGLQNGVLLRTAVDNVTGDLSDTRTRWVTFDIMTIQVCSIPHIRRHMTQCMPWMVT